VTGAAAVFLALVLAALIVAAYGSKKTPWRPVGGLMGKDKKGRTTLVIWPGGGRKKRKKKGARKK
jgi:hypothetical protein